MKAQNWKPTIFKRFVSSLDTSRKTTEVETDAGYGFIKPMFQSCGHHPLACELLGTQLANWFGLPIFEYAILELQADDEIHLGRDGIEIAIHGPAFITKKADGLEWDGSSKSLDKVENADIISSLVVFDTWTRNWDRCPPDGDKRRPNFGNVFLTSENASPNKWRLLAIDHSECFSGGLDLSPQIQQIDKVKDRKIYGVFEPFKKYIHLDLIKEAVNCLSKVDKSIIDNYIETIPSEWQVDSSTRTALREFICNRSHFLAENMVELIKSSKNMEYLF